MEKNMIDYSDIRNNLYEIIELNTISENHVKDGQIITLAQLALMELPEGYFCTECSHYFDSEEKDIEVCPECGTSGLISDKEWYKTHKAGDKKR